MPQLGHCLDVLRIRSRLGSSLSTRRCPRSARQASRSCIACQSSRTANLVFTPVIRLPEIHNSFTSMIFEATSPLNMLLVTKPRVVWSPALACGVRVTMFAAQSGHRSGNWPEAIASRRVVAQQSLMHNQQQSTRTLTLWPLDPVHQRMGLRTGSIRVHTRRQGRRAVLRRPCTPSRCRWPRGARCTKGARATPS